jgi:hypothetical protein
VTRNQLKSVGNRRFFACAFGLLFRMWLIYLTMSVLGEQSGFTAEAAEAARMTRTGHAPFANDGSVARSPMLADCFLPV